MVLKAKRKSKKDGVSSPKTTMQDEYLRDNTPNRVAINTEEKEVHYALKIFPMRDVEKRTMLLRELKVLCGSFNNCDCLVELEGAFLNQEEGTVTLVSFDWNLQRLEMFATYLLNLVFLTSTNLK